MEAMEEDGIIGMAELEEDRAGEVVTTGMVA